MVRISPDVVSSRSWKRIGTGSARTRLASRIPSPTAQPASDAWQPGFQVSTLLRASRSSTVIDGESPIRGAGQRARETAEHITRHQERGRQVQAHPVNASFEPGPRPTADGDDQCRNRKRIRQLDKRQSGQPADEDGARQRTDYASCAAQPTLPKPEALDRVSLEVAQVDEDVA